ncbi:MAG: CBS domain-containing protein [Candidatus Bathyarchaeia archaeon]
MEICDVKIIMLPALEIISKRRKKLGLTQSTLAEMAGVSQSYIAKLEAGSLEPSYLKVRAIFEALDKFERKEEVSAAEIMNEDIISVGINTSIQSAVEVMRENGFSQLPVMDGGRIVGSINESAVLEHLLCDKERPGDTLVNEIMEESFPMVGDKAPMSLVTSLLKVYPAVIVQRRGEVRGIITKSDVIGLITL